MIKVTERSLGNGLADALRLAGDAGEAAAQEGANRLRLNLSPGYRSGIRYPSLPRTSSSPREFSQFQTGTLYSMVDAERVSDEESVFGLFPRTPREAAEALAQEMGAPRNNLAARGNVRKTGLQPETQRAMVAAIARVVQGGR